MLSSIHPLFLNCYDSVNDFYGGTTMPNAAHKHPHYALRIPTATMNKLKYIAEYNGRSANKEIEQLIIKHIENFEKSEGEITFDEFTPRSRT